MNALPVLMLTQDATLWQEWQQIAGPQWMPARGQSLADLQRWKQQGRTVVVLDAAEPAVGTALAPTAAAESLIIDAVPPADFSNGHFAPLALGKFRQHAREIIDAAPAAARDDIARFDAHLVLMEQSHYSLTD